MKQRAVAQAGLVLNFVGSVLLAWAISTTGIGYQEYHGSKVYIAFLIHPTLLKTGIALLAAGFALSFLSFYFKVACDNPQRNEEKHTNAHR